jgi:hypothetical protein
MGRLGLIQQSLARFGDLMLRRLPLICLQSVVEELLWAFRLDPIELSEIW